MPPADDFSFEFDIPARTEAPVSSHSGMSAINPLDTASGQILTEGKKTRRRRKSAIGGGTGDTQSTSDGVSAEEQKALDALFEPEQWKAIVEAPGNAGTLITGSKTWQLDEKESDRLAAGASLSARYFMPTHPKWIALSLFAMSIVTVYGSKAIAYKLEQQKLRLLPSNSPALRAVGDS